MKQFGKILKFELKNYMKNKVFVGVTVLLVVIIAVVMFMPRILNQSGDESDDKSIENPTEVMLLAGDNKENEKIAKEAFENVFPDYEIKIVDNDIKSIKKQITDGDADCAFVLKGLTSYTYYVENLSMYDNNQEAVEEILKEVYRSNKMLKSGLSESQVQNRLTVIQRNLARIRCSIFSIHT
jgi:ABC-2 type transport system permease protein